MVRGDDWPIPPALLVDAIRKTWEALPDAPGIDNWGELEAATCRSFLPKEYHTIETDVVRRLCGTIRRAPRDKPFLGTDGTPYQSPKAAKMARNNRKPPDDYADYIKSDDWIERRDHQMWPFWETVFGQRCCAVCPSTVNLDMHHRTYQRVGQEKVTDCIPLCRKCHERHHGD